MPEISTIGIRHSSSMLSVVRGVWPLCLCLHDMCTLSALEIFKVKADPSDVTETWNINYIIADLSIEIIWYLYISQVTLVLYLPWKRSWTGKWNTSNTGWQRFYPCESYPVVAPCLCYLNYRSRSRSVKPQTFNAIKYINNKKQQYTGEIQRHFLLLKISVSF
jgi:hypothetical protein